jgi:hypothetical protein
MLEGRMNTQLKTSDVDKNRFGLLSTVVTALGTQLKVWVALGSTPAPTLYSKANPEPGPTVADPAMMKPSTRQRTVIDAHRGDWP